VLLQQTFDKLNHMILFAWPERWKNKLACMEDVDFRHPRGLDRSVLFSLAN